MSTRQVIARVSVLHTCGFDATHDVPVDVHTFARLGCGCLRASGYRCDGSGIEWAVEICTYHPKGW